MDWAGGYPTDINYKVGFYRNLAPKHLAMIGVLQGVCPPRGPLTYLELGCGAGVATILLAATNPDDTFIGVDFAPSHIAEANGLAAEAGISNVTFIEASFDEDGLIDQLPACDLISLHGVYTWVGPRQREAIRKILEKRLKVGGMFYVAYNNMVGSSFELVLQKALLELAKIGTSTDLRAACEILKNMEQFGAEHFKQNGILHRLLGEIDEKTPSYLIHEYLTRHWSPVFFQDLARELEASKLKYLGSAAPADNHAKFVASTEILDVIARQPDAHVRQFLLDIAANKRFRNDIFVRGARELEPAERISHLRDASFALAKPICDIDYKVAIGRGMLELRRPVFRAIVVHLSDGPNTLGQLGLDDQSLIEAVVLLSQAAIIHPANALPIDPLAARRLNQTMCATELRRSQYGFAAAPRIGSAIPISSADRIALSQAFEGCADRPASSKMPAGTAAFWRTLDIID